MSVSDFIFTGSFSFVGKKLAEAVQTAKANPQLKFASS
jgi:hypothetical protein